MLAGVEARRHQVTDALRALDSELDIFSEIRGKGLLMGAVLKPEHASKARDILNAAAAEGVMILTAGSDVIRFVPSLVITPEEIDAGMTRFAAALRRVIAA